MPNGVGAQGQIDFYGNGQEQRSGDQLELFDGERYESILSQGATQNLQANQSTHVDGWLKDRAQIDQGSHLADI